MISANLKRHGLHSAFMISRDGGIELVLSKKERGTSNRCGGKKPLTSA